MATRKHLSVTGAVRTKARKPKTKPGFVSAGIPGVGSFYIEGQDGFLGKTHEITAILLRMLLQEFERIDPAAARVLSSKVVEGLRIGEQRMKAGARRVVITDKTLKQRRK